jgi:hypothetical protein
VSTADTPIADWLRLTSDTRKGVGRGGPAGGAGSGSACGIASLLIPS